MLEYYPNALFLEILNVPEVKANLNKINNNINNNMCWGVYYITHYLYSPVHKHNLKIFIVYV
jgi:hypothetical protein